MFGVMSTLADTGFWILTSLAGGRRHGYAILREVADGSGAGPKVTTLYATLDRLVQQGLIAADGEEIVDGRARRYFLLTDAGRRRLEEETQALEARARAARAALAHPAVAPAGRVTPAMGAA
ncbi:Transcriptional regulator PadR-like family protein [Microbacterium saccharophilum]|uniref:Transcriptional regulator PadR-like family protein n=2 Tax=Microbacteriaceae TaxID=85023 RepID=A0A7Z7CZ19_9MICO|nr:Transcriptional regulator PadR-like family protein [Microbacterium saccharophilum]